MSVSPQHTTKAKDDAGREYTYKQLTACIAYCLCRDYAFTTEEYVAMAEAQGWAQARTDAEVAVRLGTLRYIVDPYVYEAPQPKKAAARKTAAKVIQEEEKKDEPKYSWDAPVVVRGKITGEQWEAARAAYEQAKGAWEQAGGERLLEAVARINAKRDADARRMSIQFEAKGRKSKKKLRPINKQAGIAPRPRGKRHVSAWLSNRANRKEYTDDRPFDGMNNAEKVATVKGLNAQERDAGLPIYAYRQEQYLQSDFEHLVQMTRWYRNHLRRIEDIRANVIHLAQLEGMRFETL